MPRFFISDAQIDGDTVTISGEDAHHISRSLRMAIGESVTVCDGMGTDYTCELTAFLPDRVLGRILSRDEGKTEPPYIVHLFQALTKGDKLDGIVQKAVECGVTDITTFESDFCIARVKDTDEKKTGRRQRIAVEAAKQSQRGRIPQVHSSLSFDAMLKKGRESDLSIFCYEDESGLLLPQLLKKFKKEFHGGREPSFSVCVGSEGGFSEKEVERAKAMGWIPVGLGRRILRTETASSFVLACLSYEFEMETD